MVLDSFSEGQGRKDTAIAVAVGIVFLHLQHLHCSQVHVLIISIVEFWNVRIAASSIPQSESRIPHTPNIARFLERWFDWQRGYRIIKHEDGREENQALLGERLADCGPGYLPRTLDELRAGVTRGSSVNELSGSENLDYLPPAHTPTETPLTIDPEDRIFDLDTSSSGITQPTASLTPLPIQSSIPIYSPPSILPQTSTEQASDIERVAENSHDNHPTLAHDQFRRVAALRREVQRLRAGIERVMSSLQELVPDSQDALQHTLQHTTNLTTRLGSIEDFLRNSDNGTGNPITMDQIFHSDSMDWSADAHAALGSQPTSGPRTQTTGNAQIPLGGTSRMFNFGDQSYVTPEWSSRQSTHEGTTQPAQGTLTVHERQVLEATTQLADARRNEEYQRHLVSTATRTLTQNQAQTVLRRAIEHREQRERVLANLELSQRQNAHIFGSREEIERQGNNYESPISHMFNQYGTRYQAAEEQRRQQSTTHGRLSDAMAGYADQPSQVSTPTESEHVRTVEDIRQELHREAQGSHQSRSNPSREQLFSRRQHQPPSTRQTVPAQTAQASTPTTYPSPITYQTPYLSAYLRNNGNASTHGQTIAALQERLTAAEASALGARSQQRRAAAHRETRARTDGGLQGSSNTPPGPYSRRTQRTPAPMELDAEATALMMLQQQENVVTADFPGRAAAMQRRLRLRREDIGSYVGLYGSDEDDLSRSDIDRYVATGVLRSRPEAEPPKSLDKDDGRPQPLSEDEMMVKMECKICFAQIATIAMLPCGKFC